MPHAIEGGGRLRTEDSAPPLVSIITVVFRARQHLPALLDSILEPRREGVELIVVDGGSDDGTVEYLQSLDNQIDYWCSEPDQGIYDAMNKAIEHARGAYLLHLNAGDRLLRIPTPELQRALQYQLDLLSFPVELDRGGTFHPSYGRMLRYNNTLHHQGTFYRREHFPLYDLRYRIFADFDVNQRLSKAGAKGWIMQQAVAWHDRGGVSAVKNPAAIDEFLSVIAGNYGSRAVLLARVFGKWRGLKEWLKNIIAMVYSCSFGN